MPTNSTPASQPSPAPTKPCPFCGNVDEVYAGGVTYCDNCGTDGPSYYRDGKPVATWNDRAEQPPPTRSDMPQECEDCGRSMTRCACCPARSDKDAELSPCPFCGAHMPHMWSLTLDGKEHSITCTECPGRAVFKSSSREQAIAAWNRRAAKAQESAPSSNKDAERANLALPIQVRNWDGEDCLFDAKDKPLWVDLPKEEYRSGIMEMVRIVNASAICTCPSGDGSLRWPCPKHPVDQGTQAESAPSSERCAECGLGCAPGVCIYGAANEITDVLGLFARRATAGPSSEVSFDAFWSDEVARNGGHGFGADYKHWARKGFDAARRATAGTTAAPSGEPDTETLQFLTDVVTAAGLLEHGRTCKALAKRIADAAYKMRESLFATHEMGVDAVRRAFEAYVARSGEFTDWTRLKDGYARPRVQFAWNTWLAALARRATAGPSSESIDLDKLEAVARKGFKARDSSGAIQSLAEIRDMISLARSATAGTTAAPSAWPVQVPEGVYYSAEHDNFYSVDNKGMGQGFYERWAERKDQFPVATLERATAGNAAPTEAEAVEGGASALRAEPAGQHNANVPAPDEIDFLTEWLQFIGEPVGVECCGRGYGDGECCNNPVPVTATLQEVEKAMNERLNELVAKLPAAGAARQGGVTCNNASSELASPAATAAPGDLPREWVQKTWFDCNQDVFAFTREVLASNAGAAPGWQTVPKEPTEAMVHAAEDLPAPRMFAKVYRAMLAAAPSNPPVGAHESERKAP